MTLSAPTIRQTRGQTALEKNCISTWVFWGEQSRGSETPMIWYFLHNTKLPRRKLLHIFCFSFLCHKRDALIESWPHAQLSRRAITPRFYTLQWGENYTVYLRGQVLECLRVHIMSRLLTIGKVSQHPVYIILRNLLHRSRPGFTWLDSWVQTGPSGSCQPTQTFSFSRSRPTLSPWQFIRNVFCPGGTSNLTIRTTQHVRNPRVLPCVWEPRLPDRFLGNERIDCQIPRFQTAKKLYSLKNEE